MKGCINTYVVLSVLLLQVYGAADKTLFGENDYVIVYKENNYKQELYDGQKAHLFLLYSSWCGHCQRFAPTYKKLAEAVKAWSDIIRITGVDCVFDTAVCRNYNVKGYPTIRFIGPTTNASDVGITYEGSRAEDSVINFIVDQLAKVEKPPSSWPNLKEITDGEATSYKSNAAVKRPKIVLFVEQDKIAQRLLLDLQNVDMRYAKLNSTAARILGAKALGLGVLSSDGQMSFIPYADPDYSKLEVSINSLLNNGTSGDGGDSDQNTNGDHQGVIDFVDTSMQYKIYELDMQSAINTALYMEVALKTEFTATELENLKRFLSVVLRCGSWTLEYKKQLARVKNGVEDLTSLNNTGWSDILAHAEDAGFPKNSTFLGCRGSKSTTRGYTCGLWILFHTMLTSCYNTTPGSVKVLQAIHGYVDSFFTCSHCRTHFLSMSERMNLLEVEGDQTAVLAFWEAHNQVNHRLSTEPHDPYFPKLQYPPRSLCKRCSNDAGQFNTEYVFSFLLRHYRRVLTPFGKTRVTAKRKNKKGKENKKKKKQKQ